MSNRTLIGALALIALVLLLLELRWVLLILFGAVVLAVALDVPIVRLRALLRLNRPAALSIVMMGLVLLVWGLITLLLPEVIEQVNQLGDLLPGLSRKLASLTTHLTWLPELERQIPLQGFRWLPIRNEHLLAVAELESDGVHRDPFDRLLVCQSRVEPMLLLSVDNQLGGYGATVNVVT